MKQKEMTIRQKELDLRNKELDLRKKEMEERIILENKKLEVMMTKLQQKAAEKK